MVNITCNHCGATSDEFDRLNHARGCPGNPYQTMRTLRAELDEVKAESAETCRKLLEDNHRLEIKYADCVRLLEEAERQIAALRDDAPGVLVEDIKKLRAKLAKAEECAVRGCIKKLNDTRGFHVNNLPEEIQEEFIEDLRNEIRAAIGAKEE